MASFTVEVAPSVLIWARTSAGLSLEAVAKRMGKGIGEVDIMAWEEGVQHDPAFASLTFARLQALAAIYRRPVAVFYLDGPPKDFLVPTDYRRVSGAGPESPTTELRFELRRLAAQRDAAIEMATIAQDMPAPIAIKISLDDDPEDVGARIRSWLDISLGDQARWAKNALRFWTRSLETKGILVAQMQGVSVAEIRGCSLSEQPFPVLAINSRDAPGGRLFTLLHELAHLLLDESGLCDLHEVRSKDASRRDQIERFCNAVAASALMPHQSVLQVLGGDPPPIGAWSDGELRLVADRHGVSQEAALLRLVTLDMATRQEYEDRRQLFVMFAMEARERRKEDPSDVRIPVARRRLSAYGRRFVEDAVNAYEREDITASDLADYLDMKLDHLPKMTKLLRSGP